METFSMAEEVLEGSQAEVIDAETHSSEEETDEEKEYERGRLKTFAEMIRTQQKHQGGASELFAEMKRVINRLLKNASTDSERRQWAGMKRHLLQLQMRFNDLIYVVRGMRDVAETRSLE